MNDKKHFDYMGYYRKIRFLMEHIGLVKYHRSMIAFCEKYFNNGYNLENKNGVVGVEIGCRLGSNALQIMKRLHVDTLYLIDPFEPYDDTEAYTLKQQQMFYDKFIKNIEPYKDKIVFFKDYSYNVIDRIPDNLDFCYIDGAHFYKEVLKDISLYYPKIRSDGVIGGHDWNWKGVASAVLDFCREQGLYDDLHGLDPDWWLVKK